MHTVDATLRTSGPRPQNIPIDVKTVDLSAFKPSRPVVEIDYSAMELRVMQHVGALVTRREARNGRRRSRQCRGSRARNFRRAKARSTSAWADAAINIDAMRSGAFVNAHVKGATSLKAAQNTRVKQPQPSTPRRMVLVPAQHGMSLL